MFVRLVLRQIVQRLYRLHNLARNVCGQRRVHVKIHAAPMIPLYKHVFRPINVELDVLVVELLLLLVCRELFWLLSWLVGQTGHGYVVGVRFLEPLVVVGIGGVIVAHLRVTL